LAHLTFGLACFDFFDLFLPPVLGEIDEKSLFSSERFAKPAPPVG
jgi:hypothetical protein